jgi:hypothetical protein
MRVGCSVVAAAVIVVLTACSGSSEPTRKSPGDLAGGQAGAVATGPVLELEPAQTARLRGAILAGVERDFAVATNVAPGFEHCFVQVFGRDLTRQSIHQLAAVYRGEGQPATAQELNRRALPAAARCGHKYEVPKLIAASNGLRSVLPNPPLKPIGQGSAVAGCGDAIGGPGARDWRSDATAVGSFGFWGSERDFRTARKTPVSGFPGLRARRVRGPILGAKVPVFVAGRKSVLVTITPEDRPRAGYAFLKGGPYAEIRFVPCRDQPQTAWPGGWALRNREPVHVMVEEAGRPASELVVGRP